MRKNFNLPVRGENIIKAARQEPDGSDQMAAPPIIEPVIPFILFEFLGREVYGFLALGFFGLFQNDGRDFFGDPLGGDASFLIYQIPQHGDVGSVEEGRAMPSL